MKVVWLGTEVPYQEVHELQQRLLEAVASGAIEDTLLMLEHAAVYTVGRHRGAADNILNVDKTPVVSVERGGDVTWHGPGQLVAYPIVRLEGDRQDLRGHLRALEDGIMLTLRSFGLDAERDERNTGVWLPGVQGSRKVASIGIAVRRWVTWHGLAINVDPDMRAFSRVNPCGMSSDVMTSLAQHCANVPSVMDLCGPLAKNLSTTLGVRLDPNIYSATDIEKWLDAPEAK